MNTIRSTLLLTSALMALSGCFLEDSSEQSSQQDISEAPTHMQYVETITPAPKPLDVRTLSSSYLIARHAQTTHDWNTASTYMNKVMGEYPALTPDEMELFKKRAMILNLGAGKLEEAHYYAKNLSEKEANPLSVLVLTLPYIHKKQFDLAEETLESMSSSGISDLIKPIFKNWIDFAQNRAPIIGTPEAQKKISGQELYHLFLGADYIDNIGILKKLSGVDFPKTRLNVQALIHIADILVRHGLSGRALSIYQDLEPNLSGDQEIEAKRSFLENGQEIAPDLLFQKLNSPQAGLSMAILDLGMLLFQEQSYDSAAIFAHLSLNLDSTFEEAHMLLGYISTQQERYDDAIKLFQTVTQKDMDLYIQAQQKIADLLEYSGDFEGAFQTLNALQDYQEGIDLQIHIGDLARQNEQYEKALEAYNQAFNMIKGEIQKEHWGLYYSRGIVFERLNQWDHAEADFKKALELEPNHPYVLNYLGYSWADQGKNLEEALDMITKAVNIRPDDAYIVDSLGWVYYKLNAFHKAVDPLERAVALFPEDPTINDHLGDAYWKVGRKHEARFQWSRALSFAQNPSDNLSETESRELITQLKEKLNAGL